LNKFSSHYVQWRSI